MALPTLTRRTASIAAASASVILMVALLAVYNAGLHHRSVVLSRFQTAFHAASVTRYQAPNRALVAGPRSGRRPSRRGARAGAGRAFGTARAARQREIAAFERAFGELKAAHLFRGVDEESGVEGDFRRAHTPSKWPCRRCPRPRSLCSRCAAARRTTSCAATRATSPGSAPTPTRSGRPSLRPCAAQRRRAGGRVRLGLRTARSQLRVHRRGRAGPAGHREVGREVRDGGDSARTRAAARSSWPRS